ncbi:FimV/HubP family polar landmark protein [Rheinheimera gaetbuli]
MPLLFVVIIMVFVNFSSSVLAQETTIKLRGPRSTDTLPAPPTIGPLAPSDTLWRVADRIRPQADISLYQVMYALYQKNPDAFIDNNLNHLRPGSVLLLPTASEMRQVDVNLARQKSELDDERWARRQKVATEPQASAVDVPGQQPKVTPATQWRAELEQLSQQQRQDLDALRGQFADSMQLVETIVGENLQLKTNLAKVQHDLELLKAQLGEDSEIQQQLKQLLQQQQQSLQEKAEQEAKLAESDWSDWLTHPLMWILAACIPALLVLLGVLFWVKKRGKHTEQVVNAATNEATANPAYQSPLPPLDDNADVDESLFEIDDALLEDAFNEPPAQEEQKLHDDLLEFDDALSFDDDDSLLPADSAPLHNDDDVIADEFDPENILSDDDLSALLAAADDDDDVIELADDSQAQDELNNLAGQDDDLLSELSSQESEIDLEQPARVTDDDTSLASAADDDIGFDIDELIEEIDLDEPDRLVPDEPSQAEQLSAALSQVEVAQEESLTEPVDDIAEDIITQTEATVPDAEQYSPDRTELDDFAESLAVEGSDGQRSPDIDEGSEILDIELTDDENLLSAELSELLDQASELMPVAEPDAVTEDLNFADSNTALLPDDDILLLDDIAPESDDDKTLVALDLSSSEDDSVQKLTDAALSVENPSKMLEQYPELELTDDDLLSELTTDMLLDELDDVSVIENDSDSIPELELDPVPEAQFDTLMSELEAMADNLDQAEQDNSTEQANDDLLAELEQQAEPGHNFVDDDFVEIDSLLASAGSSQDDSQRFNNLNVDVGLEDYADIIGVHEQRDVDTEDNGYSAKLDLVRAYIEIEDTESAELILDEILTSDAPEHVKAEAERLKS